MVKSVLFLCGSLDFRGSTVHTLNLARSLKAAGVEVHVVASGGSLVPRFRESGIPLYLGSFLDRPLVDRFLLRRLVHRLREAEPALVHAQTPSVMGLGAGIARRLGLPWAVTVHQVNADEQPLKVDARAGGIVAVSEAVREQLVNRCRTPKEKIRVIPNGVDLERLPRRRSWAEGDSRVVGSLGRLERVRGFDIFIEAASRLVTDGTQAHFLIAGEGDEREALSRLSRRLGLEKRLTFAEDVQESGPVLSVMDVFILPSIREGLGQFLLEAMASGLPVVAAAVGGVYSVIQDGETGLLVPRRDPAALAAAIRKLLDDPELATRLGEAGRELVRREFPMARVVESTLEFYENLLVGEEGEVSRKG